MQVGIDSFAAAHDDASLSVSPSERLRRLVEQIEFADQLGLDVFGVGEHHRQEFLDSAPVVILGAAAARTQRICLTSAVTVRKCLPTQYGYFKNSQPWIFYQMVGQRWLWAVAHSSRRFPCLVFD